MECLSEISLRPVFPFEEQQFQDLMQRHHYLGSLPKIGETIWYVAIRDNTWIALVTFSAASLKCAARDDWIGWNFRHQYDRLKLITNNSRFLILPDWHIPNLGSRILSLCQKRILEDWQQRFSHPVLLLETFVDPQHFQGTVYKASNWLYVGRTKGFQRTRQGDSAYSTELKSPKMVFLKPLKRNAQSLLAHPILDRRYHTKGAKIMISAEQMKSLPGFFEQITDPRRREGLRHRLSTVLAISAGAILCGMRGYRAISDWAQNLGKKARKRFGCRYRNGSYTVPSEYVIRNILTRVDPVQLDQALIAWNEYYGIHDESLAIDGKTMRNAIDEEGHQTHIMSAVGHQSKVCHTQKK